MDQTVGAAIDTVVQAAGLNPASMVERVAKALHDYQCDASYIDDNEMARVAIEAMREPTEAMTQKAGELEGIWYEMIDAALKAPA